VKVQAPWDDWLAEPLARDHFVLPYNDERTLIEALALFAGAGLGKGEAVVLVVTADRAAALRERLQRDGFEVADLERWGQLRILDAYAMLDIFLVDGQPEAHCFRALSAILVAEARTGSRNGRIRVYGEMVDLLCLRGQPGSALALEMLWNEAVTAHGIPLFCAYHVPRGQVLAEPLLRAHTHVVPPDLCA
jgi:hypothetical protein